MKIAYVYNCVYDDILPLEVEKNSDGNLNNFNKRSW